MPDYTMIKFKKMDKDAVAPEYKTKGAAAVDLCANETVTFYSPATGLVGLGVAVQIPEGHFGLLTCRSSLPLKKNLVMANGTGIIDADYRGELKLMLHTVGEEPVTIEKGERIAQLVIIPCRYDFMDDKIIGGYVEVDDLEDTDRGEGGFGSTGSH